MKQPKGEPETMLADVGDPSDVDLLRRIAEHRDRAALTVLYSRYFQTLQRFLFRVTSDLELAQEGINDVMLVVWRRAGDFSGHSKVSTWILGIAYRKGLKLAERARRWSHRFKAADWSTSVEPFAASPGHTDALALEDLIGQALKALSPKHRAVVELTYVQGFSCEEIAQIVNCPVNTVKTRMFHARARLREIVPMLARDETDV